MTREELDFIGSMNMCDEISNEAYKKIVCHCEGQEPCEDAISRQAAIRAYCEHECGKGMIRGECGCDDCGTIFDGIPSAQQQYEPVTAEDFAKTMSKYTLYSFWAWHGEAIELMEGKGFVICKKTM